MGHLAKTEFAVRRLISQGRLTGWDPRFVVGYEELLFLGPGFTWAVSLTQTLSLGILSVEADLVGSWFEFAALGAAVEAATEFREHGTFGYLDRAGLGATWFPLRPRATLSDLPCA